jgi:hypothetical protein
MSKNYERELYTALHVRNAGRLAAGQQPQGLSEIDELEKKVMLAVLREASFLLGRFEPETIVSLADQELANLLRGDSLGPPDDMQRSGAAAAAGWFNFSLDGNTLSGRLLEVYERPDHDGTGRRFFQVQVDRPCEVRRELGDDSSRAQATPGDVVNVIYGPRTRPWQELCSDIRRGAVYHVWGRVGKKVKLRGGQSMRNFDAHHRRVTAAEVDAQREEIERLNSLLDSEREQHASQLRKIGSDYSKINGDLGEENARLQSRVDALTKSLAKAKAKAKTKAKTKTKTKTKTK